MQILTKEFKVFDFDELSEKSKKVAIDLQVEFENECFDCNFILEDNKKNIEEFGFKNVEIHYSGFCSQGDGACFDCSGIDILYYIKDNIRYRWIKFLIEKDLISLNAGIWKNSFANHYSHERTRYFDILIECGYCYKNSKKRLFNLINALIKEIENLRLELSQKIYKELSNYYFDCLSEETAINNIKENEYKFLENGEIFDL